jgi:hypothetical protein
LWGPGLHLYVSVVQMRTSGPISLLEHPLHLRRAAQGPADVVMKECRVIANL